MKAHIHPANPYAEVRLAAINPIYEFLDGQTVVIDGVEGKLKLQVWIDRYNLTCYELTHEATDKGKQSARYQAAKRELGDDYVTDITYADDLVEMAYCLGYRE